MARLGSIKCCWMRYARIESMIMREHFDFSSFFEMVVPSESRLFFPDNDVIVVFDLMNHLTRLTSQIAVPMIWMTWLCCHVENDEAEITRKWNRHHPWSEWDLHDLNYHQFFDRGTGTLMTHKEEEVLASECDSSAHLLWLELWANEAQMIRDFNNVINYPAPSMQQGSGWGRRRTDVSASATTINYLFWSVSVSVMTFEHENKFFFVSVCQAIWTNGIIVCWAFSGGVEMVFSSRWWCLAWWIFLTFNFMPFLSIIIYVFVGERVCVCVFVNLPLRRIALKREIDR